MAVYAFPNAVGAGANVTGGRGGKVCHVDTLTWDTAVTYDAGTDSYSGGFYNMFYELDIPAKQIVFTVSGVISPPNQTVLNFGTGRTYNANVTISGQSAPGKIVFETSFLQIKNVHNVIWRYCSFAYTGNDVGAPYYTEVDALYITDDNGLSIENVIFDHCSLFYGNDECLDISSEDSNAPILNVTVQNCLIAGASKGMMLGNANSETQATACYNAFVDINYRTPNLYGNSASRLDAYCNFIENPFNRWIRVTGAGSFNVQNYYVQTNYFTGDNAGRHTVQYIDTAECAIHSSGNIKTGEHDIPTSPDFDDIWWTFLGSSAPYGWQDLIPNSIKVNTPMTLIGRAGTIHDGNDLDTLVLPYVGNNARLDADGTIINDSYTLDSYYLDLAQNPVSAGTTNRYPATQYPSVPSGTPYVSTLKDGIPDVWRSLNMSGESHDDFAPSGYTWIEEFHNQVDSSPQIGEIPVITIIGDSVINLNNGDTYNEQGATATDIEDGNISPVIIGGDVVNTSIDGTYIVTYNIQDSDLNWAVQKTRTINVTSPGGGNVEYNLSEIQKAESKQVKIKLIKTNS